MPIRMRVRSGPVRFMYSTEMSDFILLRIRTLVNEPEHKFFKLEAEYFTHKTQNVLIVMLK